MSEGKMGNGEWGMGSGKWERTSPFPTPHSPLPIPRFLFLFFCLTFFCLMFSRFIGNLARPALGKSQQKQEKSALVRLGERLFKDDRFSTPSGDLPASGSNCHLFSHPPRRSCAPAAGSRPATAARSTKAR